MGKLLLFLREVGLREIFSVCESIVAKKILETKMEFVSLL